MTPAEAKFLLDPYLDWTTREHLPVHEGAVVDLAAAETRPWPRLGDGCRGAFAHLDDRGDWTTVFVLDVPPDATSAPQQHLYDEVLHVLSGQGRIVVELQSGNQQTIELAPGDVFTPPLNARYRLANGSSHEVLRLASVNNLRILMNIFHDEAFFFDNPIAFPEREGRGNLSRESSLEAHVSELPAGTRDEPRGTGSGLHVVCMQGAGHTLVWRDGGGGVRRVDWRPGLCFALPEDLLHQHVNTGPHAASCLSVGFGTGKYPIVFARQNAARPEMTHGLSRQSRIA